MWSNECFVAGDDHTPWLTLHSIWDPVDPLCCQAHHCLIFSLLFAYKPCPSRAASQPVRLQPVFLQVVLSSSVQNFPFVLIEFSFKVPAGLLFQPVWTAAQPFSILTGPPHNLVSSAKLTSEHYIAFSTLFIDLISKVPKWTPWYPACYQLLGSVWLVNHLNGDKVVLAQDRISNSSVMILHVIMF